MAVPDPKLPGAATSGSETFDRCFEAHYGDVLAFASRRVADAAEAEDVLAETFGVAWRRRDSIPEPPLPWLYGVARRVLANRRRGFRRADQLATKIASQPMRHASDPSELVLGRMSVLSAFAMLSEAERETLRLIAWEGLDTRDAARAAGCSRATFRVRLHRARRKLERNLQIEDDLADDGARPCPQPQES